MATLHQAEHLAGGTADLQGLAIELPLEGIERAHDVPDGAVAMILRVRSFGAIGQLEHARVCLRDHLLAVVHADEVLLEDVVVEHVLGCLAEIDDPLAEVWRSYAVGHVLPIHRAGGMVIATDTADATRDEVGVPRVLALHEDAVATEDRRSAKTLNDLLLGEVDLRVDTQAAHDPSDRIPGHLDQVAAAGSSRCAAAPADLFLYRHSLSSFGSSSSSPSGAAAYQLGLYPVFNSLPLVRHLGS